MYFLKVIQLILDEITSRDIFYRDLESYSLE